MYRCQAYLSLGKQATDEGKYGMGVAFLQAGIPNQNEERLLNDRRIKEFMPGVMSFASKIQSYMRTSYERALSDNTKVYYDTVPPIGTLIIPEGINIVKPVAYTKPELIPITLRLKEVSSCMLQ